MNDARQVLLRMIEMFATGDTALVAEVVADDYVDHQGLRDLRIEGPVGFAEVVKAARIGYATLSVEASDLVADGDRVAARLHWHGETLDGTTVRRETLDLIRVSDGRAVDHWGARLSKTREEGPAQSRGHSPGAGSATRRAPVT